MAGFQPIQGVVAGGPYRAGVAHGGFGDTTFTKIFVGGLAWETQSETMRKYFEQFGEILEAVVITDKTTGRSKGYGFVTFRDPESARRACADPNPIIDGRRANCNLASLGRPRPPQTYGRMRPGSPYVGASHGGQAYISSPTYHPQPIPLPYQQGFVYSPYGYTAVASEYTYPQNFYNPFTGVPSGVPYPHLFGSLGAVNPVYPFAHIGQHLQTGPGYPALQSYGVPTPQLMQFPGPGASTVTAISQPYGAAMPAIQGPFPSAVLSPVPTHQPYVVTPQAQQQFTQSGNGSDQPAG